MLPVKTLCNPVNHGRFRSSNPGAAELGGAVSPAALRALRANATMSAEGW